MRAISEDLTAPSFTIDIAVVIAIICVLAIAIVRPSQKPRHVNVLEAAAINPLITSSVR
jgi:hypothetical protein